MTSTGREEGREGARGEVTVAADEHQQRRAVTGGRAGAGLGRAHLGPWPLGGHRKRLSLPGIGARATFYALSATVDGQHEAGRRGAAPAAAGCSSALARSGRREAPRARARPPRSPPRPDCQQSHSPCHRGALLLHSLPSVSHRLEKDRPSPCAPLCRDLGGSHRGRNGARHPRPRARRPPRRPPPTPSRDP